MTNVTCLHHALPMCAEIIKALADPDANIIKAVNAAKSEGLTQGLILALLPEHAHGETARMVAK